MPLLHIVTMARLTCKPSLSKYYMTMIISKINLKHLLIVICNHFPLLSVTYDVKCDIFEKYFKQDNE